MKKIHLIYAACLLVGMGACAASVQKQVKDNFDVWKEYNTGAILFEDKAPETLGSDIYHRIIPDAESYIKEQARTVLATLYNSPEDSIPAVHKIHYTLEDINGISAKGGGNGDVTIFYSTRHIEKSFAANDTAKLFFETRGVLLHELTHAYQLEPQGIGSYGTNRVFWAFIEGMADAVRVANGGFDGPNARPKGGNYMDGYRTAGYFFVSGPLIGLFMKTEAVVAYGSQFLRCMCVAQPFLCLDFLAVGVFQACGLGQYALLFAVLRKIVLEIPALYLLNRLFPLYGLPFAQPVTECILCVAAVLVLFRMFKKMEQKRSS